MTYLNLLGALRDCGVDMERAASRSASGTFALFLHVTARPHARAAVQGVGRSAEDGAELGGRDVPQDRPRAPGDG